MRSYTLSGRTRRPVLPEDPDGLAAQPQPPIMGQPEAIETIIPYIQMHQAGSRPRRPAGGRGPTAGPNRNGQNAHGGSARRSAARQQQESSQS